MSYVIYEKATTRFVRILRSGCWQDASYKTEGAAKAALKQISNDPSHSAWRHSNDFGKVELAIAERGHFHKCIELQRPTRNILNPEGGTIYVPMNTPASCDPGTETYHSM